ncbi:MAG: Rid family detoxifying hydrolase [Planctomycetota bacterium]
MDKERITGEHVVEPLGKDAPTVSPGVKCQNLIFCSGQIAIDPDTGEMVNDSMEIETKQVMENLKAILTAANASMDDVLKTTIFMTNLEDFPIVSEIYSGYFDGIPPARSTIQVASLYAGAKVEIEAIAIIS